MTDKEIIKALEWLEEVMGVCTSDDEYINGQIILDLINRQQAEIERLNFENLQMVASIKKLKAEAIKEFVREIVSPYAGQAYLSKSDLKAIVENLAKYY